MNYIAEIHIPSGDVPPPIPPDEFPWVQRIFLSVKNMRDSDISFVDTEPVWRSPTGEAETLVFIESGSIDKLRVCVQAIAANSAVPRGAYGRLLLADDFYRRRLVWGEAEIFEDARRM